MHFIVGLSGVSLTGEERLGLRVLRPSGIILFAQNIDRESSNWRFES